MEGNRDQQIRRVMQICKSHGERNSKQVIKGRGSTCSDNVSCGETAADLGSERLPTTGWGGEIDDEIPFSYEMKMRSVTLSKQCKECGGRNNQV